MKNILLFLVLAALLFGATTYGATSITGKLIALDAGHGGDENGAYNAVYDVYEKDVNLDVVLALRTRLETDGANVVLTREDDSTLDGRKSRVDLAIEKCNTLYFRKCDILVSIHHNGNSDSNHDGTLVIYNEKKDIPLARALHDALIAGLGLEDEGYLHGGYGMTVYGNLVSVLTEAYYITNNNEAQMWLAGTRTPQEVDALYNGLINYFTAKSGSGKLRGR